MTVIDLAPTVVDLKLYRGDDAYLAVTVTDEAGQPADLSGATARSQIRASWTATAVLAEFTATITGNVVYLLLGAADTLTLPSPAVWDLQLDTPSGVKTIVGGQVRVTGEVTR